MPFDRIRERVERRREGKRAGNTRQKRTRKGRPMLRRKDQFRQRLRRRKARGRPTPEVTGL